MAETTLTGQEARQRLHEIVRKDVPFNKKAHEALELGKQYLGVDNVYLTRIDQDTNHWEIVVTTDTVDGQASPGLELDLQDTYCRETIEDDTSLTLHDAPDQGWSDDPAFERSGDHTYLGIPLITEEEPYGTVCFAAQEPRSDSFSQAETQFADHLTRLLERELEKEIVEGQLTNQTNLATVLHRVLRHNLRNEISVIRGHTELMADQVDDDSVGETVLNHIDGLIDLSQKARELEEVVATSSERQTTEIGTLIEEIAAEISQDYPAASIAVEYDDEIQGRVLQNFDRAIEELIENAVKHSGDNPSVTVGIEIVPNGIQIQIKDNGPGLPDHEAEVLTSGVETPLAHGSGLGLWLAYWIVSSHDGSIDPEITEHGTTMTVTIPRKPDVTVQQQVTELTRSRDKYKITFEEANDAIAIVNDDGRVVDANEAASTIFGVEDNELLGRSLTEFFPDEFAFDTDWRDFQETGDQRDTVRVLGADGVERIIEYEGTLDIIPGQHLFISRDITERKERERELSIVKERYEILLEAAPDPVFVADAETGELIEVNEAAETLLGMSSDVIIGMHQSELHPSEQVELYQQFFKEHVESGGSKRRLPDGSHLTIVTADGDRVAVEISVETVSLPDGPVTYGIFRDVSEQVAREQELEAITQRLQLALEGTDTGVWDWTIGTGEVRWGESLERLVGIEPGTFESTFDAFGEYIHPADREKVTAAVERAAETESRFQTEYRLQRENDTHIWVESRGEIYDDGSDSKRMIGIVTDITERKEGERELELAETVFENTQDALFVIDVTEDREFYIERVNAVYEELTGLSNDEIAGKTPTEAVGDEIGSEIESQYRECVERQESIKYPEEIPVNGEQRQWETKVTPVISEGRVDKLVGAMRDVTRI